MYYIIIKLIAYNCIHYRTTIITYNLIIIIILIIVTNVQCTDFFVNPTRCVCVFEDVKIKV